MIYSGQFKFVNDDDDQYSREIFFLGTRVHRLTRLGNEETVCKVCICVN